MLDLKNCLILMIDMQEKLVNATSATKEVENAKKLLKTAQIMEIPIITTEQYPKGLGATVEKLRQEKNVFEKTAFSALQENEIKNAIIDTKRKQIILFGIEAHICVYQTALDLISKGFDVYCVKDASKSRIDFQLYTVSELMKQEGVKITTVEIVIFELLKTSKHPNFKEIQKLIK